MREWIGDRLIQNLKAFRHAIVNRDFEQTIAVGRNKFEDDQHGIFAPMFEEMRRSAAELPDELVFLLLKAGWTTLCYDGQSEDDNVFWKKEFIYGSDGRCNVGFGLWQLAWGSKQPLNPANYGRGTWRCRTCAATPAGL